MTWEVIVFYLLLFDSLFAVLFSYTNQRSTWQGLLGPLSRHFPFGRGWTTGYFVLVLFIGWLLHRAELLVTPF